MAERSGLKESHDVQLCVPADGFALRANPRLNTALEGNMSEPERPSGQEQEIRILSRFQMTSGSLAAADLADRSPQYIAPGATKTELKLHEAAYFLDLLRSHRTNEAAIRYHLSALLSAVRSITFVLQKECHGAAGFAGWYEKVRTTLRADRLLKLLDNLRDEMLHEGLDLPPSLTHDMVIRHHRDGRAEAILDLSLLRLGAEEIRDPLSALSDAIKVLAQTVEDAKAKGFLKAGPARPIQFVMTFVRENDRGEWEPDDSVRGLPRVAILKEKPKPDE